MPKKKKHKEKNTEGALLAQDATEAEQQQLASLLALLRSGSPVLQQLLTVAAGAISQPAAELRAHVEKGAKPHSTAAGGPAIATGSGARTGRGSEWKEVKSVKEKTKPTEKGTLLEENWPD
eukprot:1592920-Karenia_brevis.AAC.1